MTNFNQMTPISVLRETIQEGLVGLRRQEFVLTTLLQKRGLSQENIKWQVDISTTAATGLTDTDAAPAASSDVVKAASLPIGNSRFSHTIRLTKNDIAKAAAIGTAPLKDLFRAHVDAGLQRIMQSIETNLYVGNGNTASGGIIGLNTAIKASGAYAGLNPATSGEEAWAAYEDVNSSSTVISESLMSAAKVGIMKAGGNFDLILCDYDTLQEFENAYLANSKELGALRQDPLLAQLGYDAYQYAGRPIVAGPYVPAKTMYFLNRRELALYTFVNESTQSIEGLNIVIGQIASDTTTAVVYEMAVFPQLQLRDRRSAGVISNTAA